MGLPTPKSTTPRGYKGLERGCEGLGRLWRKWRGKGDGGRSEGRAKVVKRLEISEYLQSKIYSQHKGAG